MGAELPLMRWRLLGLLLVARLASCVVLNLPRRSIARAASLPSAEHRSPGYFWPSGRGRVGEYSSSQYVGPRNLTASFDWSWHHPLGRFHTLPYGTAIDSEQNVYLFTDTSLWKLTPRGEVVWTFEPHATIFNCGSLLDGRVHFTTLDGRVWAVSMATGRELWSRKLCGEIHPDNGFVSAHEGVVIAAGNTSYHQGSPDQRANSHVFAVSAADGSTLWTFRPDVPVWNFLASFSGNGTVLYQDWEGRAYCSDLHTGALLWKAGGHPGSWTDGSPLLAGGVLYTVSARMGFPLLVARGALAPGLLTAHGAGDGRLLWEAAVPLPPNNAPAIGRLPGHSGLSVVQPGGYQGVKGGPTGIFAYDALTGALRWSFQGPPQKAEHQAGELEGVAERLSAGASGGYVTNPWSAPTVDADGTIFIGHEDGLIFALHDSDGDGRLEGDEVSTFSGGSAFTGSSGPAHAPGMLAVASCEGLFVFKA